MSWDRGWVIAWYVLIALVLLAELWAILDGQGRTPPLTQVIVRGVPWWVTLPFLAWLFMHFASRYMGRPVL